MVMVTKLGDAQQQKSQKQNFDVCLAVKVSGSSQVCGVRHYLGAEEKIGHTDHIFGTVVTG